ncbi:unnamed protein product [Closterium sp. Naga37s-1]|nr:unnamed protein product [Closterium sp. Naga37s-1]
MAGLVLAEGLERAGEVTVERGASRDVAAAAGGAGENDAAGTEMVAAVIPRMVAATVPEVAAAAVTAAETVAAGPAPAGGSAAAFGGGSTSPSATPRAAQLEAEEPSPGADHEQTAEAALSASPAPVTAAVLAAAVSAATGEQDGSPPVEGATTAAACAEMSVAAVAAGRQEHGQTEGENTGPANGASSSAARVKSKKKLRAQPAPRRPGAGLGPGSPGPLLGWLLQGQPPSEQARRSSSVHMQGERGVSGLNEAVTETTATRHAEQPALNQDTGTRMHSPPGSVAPAAEAVATRRSARLGAVTWGPPRGGRTPWMPAGRAGLEATARPAPAAGRGFRGMGRGRRGGGRGGFARLGGAEIQARTDPWRERHDRPEVLEAAANRDEAGSAEDTGDPEFMCGEEAGPESEEVSLDNEEEVGRGRNRVRGEGPESPVPAATVTNEVRSPATLAEDDAIWQAAGTWTLDLLQRMDQPFLVRRLPPQVLDKFCLCLLAPLLRLSTNPECPGAWAILLYLPRLTLRPPPEPVTGSRWAAIEARLHQFQLGEWDVLFEAACTIPDMGAPLRHQDDDEGVCARAEGLVKKALANEEILLLLANVVNRLGSTFQSQPVLDILLPSRLIALEKPGGGVRPIAIGEALLRVVAKAALHSLGPKIREFFLPV